MKKKITFGLVTFAMVAASAVFMKSIAKDDLSAMIQANVDALAEFEFGGQSWNVNDTHWVGSNWKPEVTVDVIIVELYKYINRYIIPSHLTTQINLP